MPNILFVGGGRRVTLAEEFIKRGHKIFSYETSNKVPIASVAPIILGLKWDDSLIIPHLTEVCNNLSIDLVIPLQDEAVKLVAGYKNILPSKVLAGSWKSAITALDKKEYFIFMNSNFNYVSLPTYFFYTNIELVDFLVRNGNHEFIVKPRFGCGSRGIQIISDFSNPDSFPTDIHNYIVQPYVKNKSEYTVDGYISPEGICRGTVSRLRIRVDGGEVVTSKTVYIDEINYYTSEIGKKLGIVGPYNCQFLITEDGEIYNTETNARFGGGCTLSMRAGLDIIKFIDYDFLNSKELPICGKIKYDMLMERAYRDFYFEDEQ